jgi:hypothetical protein
MIRYSIQMPPIFRTYGQLHYSSLHGTIDQNVHSGLERQFAAIMRLPGNQQYWAARREWFGDAFQEYADSVIAANESSIPANFEIEACEG